MHSYDRLMEMQRGIVENEEQEADYILQVKEKQSVLYEEISKYFEKEIFPKEKTLRLEKEMHHQKVSGDHERIERREHYAETKIGWMQDAKKDQEKSSRMEIKRK